jgi:DNA-binding NtrC family response regulator
MSYKILLVDDDFAFREEFSECLELNYKVATAKNGAAVMEMLSRPHEIDLILLDVVMPGERGTEILKTIKEHHPNLPVIIMTGHSSKDIAIEALKANADDYIEKPLKVESALATIAKHLQKVDGFDGNGEGTAEKVEHVKKFLERNFDKKVLLRDAAEAVCLSPKYLSRIFEEWAGIGFNEYRLKVKMEKAKEVLNGTGRSIDQIST